MSRPAPESREQYISFQQLQTRWADNDVYGHMNNVVHYALFDTAIGNFLLSNKLLEMGGGEIFGVVVETGCSYFAEMAYPDDVTAGIRVAHIGNSSVRYEIGLFRNDEQQTSARGHFVHVYLDRRSRKPVSLPQQWQSVLKSFQLV